MEAMKRSATNGKQYDVSILKNCSNVKTIHDVGKFWIIVSKLKQTSNTDDKSDWSWAEKKQVLERYDGSSKRI